MLLQSYTARKPCTLFICVGHPVGNRHASTGADAEKNTARSVYDRMRRAWSFIRNAVRPGTCHYVWDELSGNDILDHRRAANGFPAWNQQFLLRDLNRTDYFRVKAGRTICHVLRFIESSFKK